MTYFTETEARVLTDLYDDVEAWWGFLYVVSDRVAEDHGDDAGEAVRFLCRIRQRPYYDDDNDYWRWYVVQMDVNWQETVTDPTYYANYLPRDFHDDADETSFVRSFGFVPLLDYCIAVYVTLAPDRRAELWRLTESLQTTY